MHIAFKHLYGQNLAMYLTVIKLTHTQLSHTHAVLSTNILVHVGGYRCATSNACLLFHAQHRRWQRRRRQSSDIRFEQRDILYGETVRYSNRTITVFDMDNVEVDK